MDSVEKTVEGVKLLIASGDLSDNLHLRQLHKECVHAFKELNANLEKCRSLVENGSIQAARELNCSFEPSLTQVAEYLEFLKTSDFFSICREYGLESPVFPDDALLQILNMPITNVEKHLHVLLQDYRKIARSGTMHQRINLLRQIVKKLPNSDRWRNDLLSAERTRAQEIEREIAQLAGNMDCCQQLEELYREVLSPDWTLPPEKDLVEKIRLQLLPQQQARLNKEVEQRLQTLHDYCAERNIDLLEKEFAQWQIFCTTPMLQLTEEQKQSAASFESFLNTVLADRKKEQTAQDLIRKIEQQLADNNVPFAEVMRNYNQLQLMDYDIPTALEDRIRSLEEENAHYESLRHIRWCVGGVCGVVLLVVVIVFSVTFIQHYMAVKRNWTNMDQLFRKEQYQEVIRIYNELSKSSPKTAKAPQIISVYTRAQQELKEIKEKKKLAKQEFLTLLDQIGKLSREDVLDNKEATNRAIETAEKIHAENPQDEESWKKFSDLKTAITQKRTKLKQKREQEFIKFCRDTVKAVQNLIREIPDKTPGELNVKLSVIREKFNKRLANSPYVPQHLKDQERTTLADNVTAYNEALEKEKAFRLINMPDSFESYLNDLDNAHSKYPDLGQKFSKAFFSKREWKNVYDSYVNYRSFPKKMLTDVTNIKLFNSFFREDLEKYMPKQQVSSSFARFFQGLQKQKNLKELIFTSADKRDYFFYVAGQVRVEKLRNPRRTNITFTAVPVNNEKRRLFVFTCKQKNEGGPFVLMSKHDDIPYSLPASFALMNGKDQLPAGNMAFPNGPWHLLSTLALGTPGPGINANLLKGLQHIYKDGNVKNAYLREILFNLFLQELYESAPLLYQEIGQILPELQKVQQQRICNWRAPQVSPNYADEKKALEEKWNQLDLQRLLRAGELRGDLICSLHARGLVPAGVLRIVKPDKLQVHLFRGVKKSESFILDLSGNKKSFVLLPQEVWDGKTLREKKWNRLLFPGQVIWSFADGRSNRDFIRDWQDKAKSLNISLNIKSSILPADFYF